MLPGPDLPTNPPALRLAKQGLRGRILAQRDDLPAETRAADAQAIVGRLEALASLAFAHTVLLTFPFGTEWDTRPLAAHALSAGKRVVVPRVDRVARMLRLHAVANPDVDVVAGYLGIPEPRASLPIVEPDAIDWVLVPGVAFDAAGRRLGYGGGFFDRLLPLIRASAPRIAGAFEVQIVDEVPAGPHDQRVDAVVSPTRTLVVGS
jgi:5-formyltetrahydrofolate cyclo-ligase